MIQEFVLQFLDRINLCNHFLRKYLLLLLHLFSGFFSTLFFMNLEVFRLCYQILLLIPCLDILLHLSSNFFVKLLPAIYGTDKIIPCFPQ